VEEVSSGGSILWVFYSIKFIVRNQKNEDN
jgi:hypothetical protein